MEARRGEFIACGRKPFLVFLKTGRCWPVEALPGGSAVKNLPAMQEPQEKQVQSLGQKDPLEEDTVIHTSILAWRLPWTEEPGGLHP